MDFKASARYIKRSPFKLRPIVDVIRGKNAQYALDWLKIYGMQKAVPVKKALESAIANAKDRQNMTAAQLKVAEVRVDAGPVYKYFKPGAMGRSVELRRRLSHISIVLQPVA